MKDLEERVKILEEDQAKMKTSMDSNTAALQEFIELGKSFKFGLRILGAIESTAVWITKVALAVGTIITIWKFIILETISRAKS